MLLYLFEIGIEVLVQVDGQVLVVTSIEEDARGKEQARVEQYDEHFALVRSAVDKVPVEHEAVVEAGHAEALDYVAQVLEAAVQVAHDYARWQIGFRLFCLFRMTCDYYFHSFHL